MKKLTVAFIAIFICLNVFAHIQDLYDTWQIENVTYTFERDTLYIDEIDNEGMGYTYKYSNDTIYAYNDCYYNDTLIFKLVSLDKYSMTLNFIQEDDTFKLVNIDRK